MVTSDTLIIKHFDIACSDDYVICMAHDIDIRGLGDV